MNFSYSEKSLELQNKLRSFMDAHIYPNEKAYEQEINSGDRWQPLELIEDLKAKAKARRFVEFVFAGSFRFDESRIRAACRDDGQSFLVVGSF